jgi:hypothetical protein
MTKSIVVAAMILSCPAFLPAQSDFRFDVHASLGVGWHDNHVGAKKNVGVGFGWRPFAKSRSALKGIGAEFETNQSWDIGPFRSQTIFTGNLLYHFSLGRTEPFAGFGFGGYDHPDYRGARARGNPPAVWITHTSVGLKVPLGNDWYIRPQLDLFNGDFANTGGRTRWFYRSIGGVGFRF